ncbi:MAG: histone deacetylase, partial [archaeon]
CYNFSLEAGSGDKEFLRIVNNELRPVLGSFNPDVVGVSAGFDSMRGDPLTDLSLTGSSFRRVCEVLVDYNSFFVLEGGYNPDNVFRGVKEIAEFFD